MREEKQLTVWRVLSVGLMGIGLSHWADGALWAALFDEGEGAARAAVAEPDREPAGRVTASPGPRRSAPPWRRTT
ncbi:hypothetical protein GCM10010269_50520 [Streptomyces humidus]|uniref:Uncharacterized protein n=1 Tax=Streptomyces humidus TaxID=52259 RepID=A0A918L5C4_9ACTN|nr:hypothetical protein [Streptomyces humidus]GGS05521.1 hypothetical protein GCM10010269_50520 [Streptomyces humidus]